MDLKYKKFLEYRHTLMAYIVSMLKDPVAAEDVFQEVWIRYAKTIQAGSEIKHCSAWCRTAARNLIYDRWKQEKREGFVFDRELGDLLEKAFSEAEDDSVWAARERALKICLEELPEHSREVLRLRFEEMLPLAEVGERLQKKVTAVAMMVSRIQLVLEQCIDRKIKAENL